MKDSIFYIVIALICAIAQEFEIALGFAVLALIFAIYDKYKENKNDKLK